MAGVLAVFASASDNAVFERLLSALKEKGISFDLRICSAHRTMKMLEKIVKESNAKIIVSGAGLSAALPGAIAAQTIKPVIGIPCTGNYDGLDALLSVQQMPPGIPVLGTGVNCGEEAAKAIGEMLKQKEKVVIVKRHETEEVKKRVNSAKEILQKFNIKFEETNNTNYSDGEKIFLDFFELNETENASANGNLSIFVPCAKQNPADLSLKLSKIAKEGLWVGLGRGENAAIAAVQIMNLDGKFSKQLLAYRKEMEEKIIEADKTEREKWGQ